MHIHKICTSISHYEHTFVDIFKIKSLISKDEMMSETEACGRRYECKNTLKGGQKCQLLADILSLKGQFQVSSRQLFHSNEACNLPKAYGDGITRN
jgi:hypothetical protein